MDDITYRLLEKLNDNSEITKHDAWIYFLHSQVVPGISNILFDASFDNAVNFSLISLDEPLTQSTGTKTYRGTNPGKTAFKNEKKARRKPIKEKYWWAIAIITFAVGCFSDIGKEWLKRKILPDTNQSQPTNPTKSDTSLTRKTHG